MCRILRPLARRSLPHDVAVACGWRPGWVVQRQLLYCSGNDRIEKVLKLDGLAAARTFFSGCFAGSDPRRESLWVAHLDDAARCLHLSRHDGDEAGTDFPLRSIIADAALHGSSAIVLAHNHPSGDPTPSDADKRATRRLACAAEALDCAVADHLVFGGPRCTSFRELGFL